MPRLLLIDDDAFVLTTLTRLVRAVCPGLDVDAVACPADAVARLAPGAYDAVLTDRNMPGVSGEEVLAKAGEVCPTAVRGLLTGDLADAVWHRRDRLVFASLQKPCRPADLRRGVGTMIEVSRAANDPTVAATVAEFARLAPPAAGDMPYDGRTAGVRWLEAVGTFAGVDGHRPASASVLRTLDPDLGPALGILVGAFEAAARIDPTAVEPIWQGALARARDVADRGADERARIADRLAVIGRAVGDLAVAVTKSEAPAAPTSAALLHSWGFTAEVVGQLLQGPAAPPPPAPRLNQSPFSFNRS
jgi:CheY-like chemotaxis protein